MPIALSGQHVPCVHKGRIIGSVKDQRVGTARGLMSTVHWNLFYQKALTASVSTINLLVLDRKRGSVQRRKTA